MLEADEQVGRDAGEFPEDEQGQQIIGKHEAEHGRHEGQQQRVHTPQIGVTFQVTPGVDDDERPDARDDKGHKQAEAIECK